MIHTTYTHPGVNAVLVAVSRAMRAKALARRSLCSEYVLRAHDRYIMRLYQHLAFINSREWS